MPGSGLDDEQLAPSRDVLRRHGDIPLSLSRWARHDGLDVAVMAVDPDPRATDFLGSSPDDRVEFRQAGSADLVAEGRRFDVVVSNHLLHHLDAAALQALLADSERLATRLALHNDLRRSGTEAPAQALRILAGGVGTCRVATSWSAMSRSLRPVVELTRTRNVNACSPVIP